MRGTRQAIGLEGGAIETPAGSASGRTTDTDPAGGGALLGLRSDFQDRGLVAPSVPRNPSDSCGDEEEAAVVFVQRCMTDRRLAVRCTGRSVCLLVAAGPNVIKETRKRSEAFSPALRASTASPPVAASRAYARMSITVPMASSAKLPGCFAGGGRAPLLLPPP